MKYKPKNKPKKNGWLSLMPLVLLVLLMGGIGWFVGDFYKVPLTVVFLLVSIISLFTLRGYCLEERIATYSQGAGSRELCWMLWIFVMAGAFAQVARAMGAVDATVDMTLYLLPERILPAGLFVASCVVSLCVGTSVGTIVALVPVAATLAARGGFEAPLVVAAVVGGSLFGDNLSFISDTTVAATRTQGCAMRDKFLTNFKMVLPAAILCFVLYVWIGQQAVVTTSDSPASVARTFASLHLLRLLPYGVVLVAALCGINVLVVLVIGLLLAAVIGLYEGTFCVADLAQATGTGISSMGELILVSMMAGGLLSIVRKGGGLTWLVRAITKRVNSRRGAEMSLSALVALTDCCTANNTIAILSVGPIAKELSRRYGVGSKRTASLLDVFSCVVQGIIPYGAQLLMASGLALISPIVIIPYLYYPFALGAVAIMSILWRKNSPRHV